MTSTTLYERSAKYTDLDAVYSQCSGPGGLKLAEFIAGKLDLKPGMRLLDIGMNGGYQTCFLAKEYGVRAIGIDPGGDPRCAQACNAQRLMENATEWGVWDRVLGVRVGVPDTPFPNDVFDVAYCVTTLEMIRGMQGEDAYRACLAEALRVLRPGGLFGYGDPMHNDVGISPELAPFVAQGNGSWADCFATLSETTGAFRAVGFEVIDADTCPDAMSWWQEYALHDPGCKSGDGSDVRAIEIDCGHWLTYGYVIAKKPEVHERE